MSKPSLETVSLSPGPAQLLPKSQIGAHVSGLHQHMLRTSQAHPQRPERPALIRHETQNSRYLSALFSMQEA